MKDYKSKKILKISNLFWLAILFSLLFMSILYGYISWDAPYYLSVSRDVANGSTMYKDIYNSYTPIMMYLNAGIFKIFNQPGYFFYLGFQYLITFLSVFIFYKICLKNMVSKTLAIFLSLALFISILSSDGTSIILEVYMIFFVFLGWLFLLNKKYFLAGLAVALSFFCKQYGILNFVPFYLVLLMDVSSKKSGFIKFTLGSLIPLFLFLFYFVVLAEIPFLTILNQLSGNGYAMTKLSTDKSILGFLIGSKVFLLLLVPLFFVRENLFKDRINVILLVGIIVNLFPVAIKQFPHYFIMTFPYLFILYARNSGKFNWHFLLGLNGVVLIISGLLLFRIIRYKEVFPQQLEVARINIENFPKGSKVYLCDGFRFLYILNDYKNPLLTEVGYRDWFVPNEEFKKSNAILMDGPCVDPKRLK